MPKSFALSYQPKDTKWNFQVYINVEEEVLCEIECLLVRNNLDFPIILKIVSNQYEDLCIENQEFPQLIIEIKNLFQSTTILNNVQKQFLELVNSMCKTNEIDGVYLFGIAD
jgi:hypothetical protein